MLKQHSPTKQKKIINNKYQLVKKLKTGGFASVYYAKSLQETPNKYAIKLMSKKYQRYASIENKIYQLIKEKKFTLGFVKYYQSGIVDDQIFMVMELIGYDLEEVQQRVKNKKFTLKTVLMIGLQTVDRLEALHSIGYIHRDIKPDNIAIGMRQKSKTIYLLDFGLVMKHTNPIPNDEKGKIIGTLGFMSLRAHQSKKATFWDDIQCFIYTLVYMLQGTLPWLQIHAKTSADYHRVKILKQKFDKEWFKRHSIPLQLYEILQISRKSQQNEKIDYLSIKYKLLSALNKINEKNDFLFDWSNMIRITHDSPTKRIQQKQKNHQIHQSNQKQIEKQIFQVYKFMDGEGEKTNINKPNKKQQEKIKRSPRIKVQEINKRNEKMNKKNDRNAKQIRPNSAFQNRVKPEIREESQFMNKFGKQLKMVQQMKFGGPKIVINRTAAHQL